MGVVNGLQVARSGGLNRRSTKRMKPLQAGIWTAALAISAAMSFAQMNVAELSGTVTDPVGGLVRGAAITATNTATKLKFNTLTNDSGQYLLTQLGPGVYSVSASADGFKRMTQENVSLYAGQKMALPFSMVIGEKSEIVTVEEGPGVLQTESAQIKDVIENQQVVDLPVKDREFLELALLGSGVVNPPGGTRGDSLQQTGKLINILGQRTGHNLFLVDGVSVTDEYFNNVVLSPSPDDTAEFMIDKTNYDAEFGGKSGAVINLITKSGTDQFHGSAYEFVRNDIFDAKNFFDLPGPAPAFRENQFGGALGGPILKHRTFFFVNYDGQRTRQSLADLFSVPTVAERAGNFAGTAAIFDPFTHQPIPGNNIANDPALHLDPAAVALLGKVPLPTPGLSGKNNLISVQKRSYDNNEYNARIDHQFSDRDNSFVRASVFQANEFDPFGSSVLNEALLPGFGRTLSTHSVNVSAAETHTFSSNLVNEFRFGWLRVSGGQGDPNAGNPFASQNGLQGVTANPADMGYPQISLSNAFSTIGSPAGFTS